MYYRRDDWVFNNFIQAIPNANVTYYTQPGLAPATVYNDANGDVVIANPQITDGFGHAVAYLAAGIYTIVYSGEQIVTETFPDQQVGGAGGGNLFVQASTTNTAPGTVITGAIPGSVFTLPSIPAAGSLSLNANGQVLNPGVTPSPIVGYSISGAVVTLYTALQTGDILNATYAT